MPVPDAHRSSRALPVAAALFGASVVALAWLMAGGVGGLAYLVCYAAATAPGWPLGFALFGRRHAAAWVCGAVLGYGLTALALWVPIAAGVPSGMSFMLAWVTLMLATWLGVRRRDTPLVALPPWRSRDTAALLFVLLLVPMILAAPFLKVGSADQAGNRFYRAYFTADFVWHMALTAEMTKFEMPPVNPYLAENRIHYYWTYFLFPTAMVTSTDVAVEQALKLNTFCAGLVFLAVIFITTWSAVASAVPTGLAVAFAVVAASAEGWFGVYRMVARGAGLAGLRHLNIDALSYWIFRGLSIDGLPRSLWWIPQHATACALGLVPLIVAGRGGAQAPLPAILTAGVALGLSLAFSPLLGAGCALVYGLVVAADAIAMKRPLALASHALITVPLLAAAAWCRANEMFEGAEAALHIGFAGHVRNAPFIAPVLALGPLLVAALPAFWRPWRLERPVWPGGAGLIVGFGIFYFVMLRVDALWAGFRAGQILLCTMPLLVACSFERLLRADRRVRVLGVVWIATLFVSGLPTTIIDAYNAQDITNRAIGPGGFRWTVTITPDQQAALNWIRHATPRDAIVQMDPASRGRETWTLIPTFAERRMAGGLPISLLNIPLYAQRSREVRRIYETESAQDAWTIARRLSIDYLYCDDVERNAYSLGVRKFDVSPRFFAPVFTRGAAAVYIVLPGARR